MGYPVTHTFAWDEAAHRLYGWKLLIAWLVFGALVNAFQLTLHSLIPQLRKQPCCRIIIWLSSIDFCFDFLCLLQCGASLHLKSFFGEQLFCTFQAFWAELLMAMSGFSIGCTMLASYMAIIHNRVLTAREIDKLHIGAFFYCTLLAFLGSIAPGEGTLNSSGLFCYTATQFVLEGVLFHIGYVFPLILTLIYFWYRMYSRVQEMTQFLIQRKIHVGARKGQVQMAKRMAWYIYILLLCFLPYELAVWYSWITGEHAPFQMWITFGMFGHVLTVASPILYYVLNASARHLVANALKKFFFCCFKKAEEGNEKESQRSREESGSSGHNSGIRVGIKSRKMVDALQLEELVNALSDSSILNQMLAFADAQWCSEGILFWIDVQVWRTMCSKISPQRIQRSGSTTPLTSPSYQSRRLSTSSPSGGLMLEDIKEKETKVLLSQETQNSTQVETPIENQQQLEELQDFARSVYLTYFVRGSEGSAPLELNIPDEIRSKVIHDLCLRKEGNNVLCQFEYKADLISLFDSSEKECLRLLYDNVFLPFSSKVKMQEIISSQERLRNLQSGDALPFNTVTESASTELQGDHLAASVVIPSTSNAVGGVSTKRRYDQEDSYSEEHSISRPKQSEILHVGIDSRSSLKLIFKEHSANSSVTSTPTLSAKTYEGPLSPIGELELISPVSEET